MTHKLPFEIGEPLIKKKLKEWDSSGVPIWENEPGWVLAGYYYWDTHIAHYYFVHEDGRDCSDQGSFRRA